VSVNASARINLLLSDARDGAMSAGVTQVVNRLARFRWVTVLALAGVMAWFRGHLNGPDDLVMFEKLGRAVVAGHISAAYASSSDQSGPLQLIAAAVPPPALLKTTGQGYFVVACGVAIAAVSMLVVRRLRLIFGLPSGAIRELLAGLVAAVWIVGGYGVRAHLAEIAIPLAWVAAGVAVSRGRWLAAGVLLGISAGFEPWGLLGFPIALLAVNLGLAGRAIAVMLATTVACYLPFLLAGPFELPKYRWPVASGTLVQWMWPHTTTFGWSPRLLQGGLCVAVGCAIALALRGRTGGVWLVPVAILLVRLIVDPVQENYYWVAPQLVFVAGVTFVDARMRARTAVFVVSLVLVSSNAGQWATPLTATALAAVVGLAVAEFRRDSLALAASDYQPRVASRWSTGTSSTLMPTIASPSPRDTLAITSGSS
jgi:hypothetical protein